MDTTRARITSQLNAAPEIEAQALGQEGAGQRMTQVLDMLDKRRVGLLNSHRMRVRLGMVLGVCVAVGHHFLFQAGKSDPLLSLQVGVGAFVLIGIWAFQPVFAYRKAYKNEFMPQAIKAFANFRYRARGGIFFKQIVPAGLFSKQVGYACEDYFFGRHNGCVVEFSQARLYDARARDYKNKREQHTLFKGMFLLVSFNQNFVGHTFITAKRGTRNAKEALIGRHLEEVSFSSDEDAARFDVYTTNKDEAKQLTSPDIIARLRSLSAAFDHAPLECAFYGKNMFIMLPYERALFAPTDITTPAFSISDIPLLQTQMRLTLELSEKVTLRLHEGV